METPQHPAVTASCTKSGLPSPADAYPELARHLTITHPSPQTSPVKAQVQQVGGSCNDMEPKEEGRKKVDLSAGWTHIQIKPEAASPSAISPAARNSRLTPPGVAVPLRPQGLSLGADALISGGVHNLSWSSLEIKSEPLSPEPSASPTVITSPDQSNPDDGYHSTSLPSTPERPPSTSSFVKIEQGASPKLRINVGESHNLAATRTGTTMQIGSLGGAKTVMMNAPKTVPSAAQMVYVKCLDAKGKMYLVPQQALLKTTPNASQGRVSVGPSQNLKVAAAVATTCSSSSAPDALISPSAGENVFPGQGSAGGKNCKQQQQLLLVKTDADSSVSTTQTTVIGSGPSSATLTYMLTPSNAGTPNKGAVSLLGTPPQVELQAKSVPSKQLQTQQAKVAGAPQVTSSGVSSLMAAKPNASSTPKATPMQLLIPGSSGTLQLMQTVPIAPAASRAVTPAKAAAISPGQSLLRKPSPSLTAAPRLVTLKPGSRSATSSPRSVAPGSLVLLQGVGSPPQMISPSARQQAPMVLLTGSIPSLQGNATTKKQPQRVATPGGGVSILKTTPKALPVQVQVPAGEALNRASPTTALNSGTKPAKNHDALLKVPDPQIVIKMEPRSTATPAGTVATVAQLLKSRVAGNSKAILNSNPANQSLEIAALANQKTAERAVGLNSLTRMNITLPKPSKKEDGQELLPIEPTYHVK